MLSKQFVRNKLRYLRNNLKLNVTKQNSRVCRNVDSVLKFLLKDANGAKKNLGIYSALSGEPDLSKLMLNDMWNIALPKVGDNNSMKMVLFDFNEDELIKNSKFKFLEPSGNQEVTVDIILVPGMGFDLKGYRIGFGQGNYDRYLAQRTDSLTNCISIGICFHQFLIEQIPHELWDLKVNFVITDKVILQL